MATRPALTGTTFSPGSSSRICTLQPNGASIPPCDGVSNWIPLEWEAQRSGPYRSYFKFIIRTDSPLGPPDQLKQHHLHFQQGITLPKTLPTMRIERNHMPLDCLLSDFVHNFFRVGAPSFGDELPRCWSPNFWIRLYARCIPADKCSLGNVDGAAKGGVAGSYAVYQLRDGRIDAEELDDDCG